MIDCYTLQHLASYTAQVIRREDQSDFQVYAILELDKYPGYWENRGWRDLYTQFLTENHRTY